MGRGMMNKECEHFTFSVFYYCLNIDHLFFLRINIVHSIICVVGGGVVSRTQNLIIFHVHT